MKLSSALFPARISATAAATALLFAIAAFPCAGSAISGRAGMSQAMPQSMPQTGSAAPAAGGPLAGGPEDKNPKTMPSPPALAGVSLKTTRITIHYNTPFMRGRKIFGGLQPYGEVWRTGANSATSLRTTGAIKIGDTVVPAGSYTLYTIPSDSTWKLIINKQTGQWGTEYDESKDLARIDMQRTALAAPQEKMSISFEKTDGASTELHVRWETTDVSVPVVAQ